jgi:threonine aldolase
VLPHMVDGCFHEAGPQSPTLVCRRYGSEDHQAAHRLYEMLSAMTPLHLREPQTNIVMLECGHLDVAAARESGVELIAWSSGCVRAVTSQRVTTAMAEIAARVISRVVKDFQDDRG